MHHRLGSVFLDVATVSDALFDGLPPVYLAGARFYVELRSLRVEIRDGSIRVLQSLGLEVFSAPEDLGDLRVHRVRVLEEGIVHPVDAVPFIVVAADGSIDSYTRAVESGAAGYFTLPLPSLSFGAALLAAAKRSPAGHHQQTVGFSDALTPDQIISTALGMLMERFCSSRADAYARLKRYSRRQRRKVADVAAELMTVNEKLRCTLQAIALVSLD